MTKRIRPRGPLDDEMRALFTQGRDQLRESPRSALMMHGKLPEAPPRSARLQSFFKQIAKCATSSRGGPSAKYDNMLGNTKAGASVIDRGTLEDFDNHWGHFSLLEKQQVLMSFLQMDPDKLIAIGKEGQDLMFSIIDNKAQLDEERWIVTLSRTMRNFPRSHSIRANWADRESFHFLTKAVDEGLSAGLAAASRRADEKAASNRRSTSSGGTAGGQCQGDSASDTWELHDDCSPSTPTTPAAEAATGGACGNRDAPGHPASSPPRTELVAASRAQHRPATEVGPLTEVGDKGILTSKILKKDVRLKDSIPALGQQNISCCPRTRFGHPPEYTVPAGMAERAIQRMREGARQDIVRMGFRPGPGPDLLSPGDQLVEDLHKFDRRCDLKNFEPWRNDAVSRNGEWVKKPRIAKPVQKASFSSIHGFERTDHNRGQPIVRASGRSRSRSRAKLPRDQLKRPDARTQASALAALARTPAGIAVGARVVLKEMKFRPEKIGMIGKVIEVQAKGKIQVRLDGGTDTVTVWPGVTGELQVVAPYPEPEREWGEEELFGSDTED